MPPRRRAVSPLALETCPPLDSDSIDCPLAGSDDEFTESQRTAQHQRIEKLGEAYLRGSSLFILSASLQGPFNKDWVNPWKKDRTKAAGHGHKRPNEQPVIPETNSHKRRQYHSPSVASRSRVSGTPQTSSRTEHVPDDTLNDKPADRAPASDPAASTQSHRFTRHQDADANWLKKGRVSTKFRNIDPPTSPTTSISSRYMKRGAASDSQSTSRPGTAGYESAKSSKSQTGAPQPTEPNARIETGINDLPSQTGRQTPGSLQQKGNSQSAHGPGSVHVVSSSSQLPKFEYRVKKRARTSTTTENRRSLDPTEDVSGEASAAGVDGTLGVGPEYPPQASHSVPSAETNREDTDREEPGEGRGEEGLDDQQDPQDSATFPNPSSTAENASSTSIDKGPVRDTANNTTSDNNLPSAQQAPQKPPPENITSLYSIAMSKATSNRTDDHNADQQFSTQAALMMAQKSFQNDLQSPEPSPVTSTRKPRGSHASNHQSPNAVNITPFHMINNPDRDAAGRPGSQQNDGMPMVSTQYMIDAATPFTFSTEKKAGFRTLSSGKDKSKAKKRKTTSFALSSPSEIPSEHYTSDEEETGNAVQGEPAEGPDLAPESQQSAFPLTLTGTTPPTVQEGQGAESFDLSQALKEAGSWLQQSFEINRDITHCGTAKAPQPHPVGSKVDSSS